MEKFEEREWLIFVNEGQKIFGVMHRPLSNQPTPVVIMCHGFGGSKSGRYRHYVKLAVELAKVGIATLRFDFRGSGDSEGELTEMTIEGEISDALKAIETVSKDPTIDSSRMGILGRSLGGAIAVQTAQRHGNIKSMVLWAPLFSSEKWQQAWSMAQKHPEYMEQIKELKFFGGTIPNKELLNQFFSMRLENDLSHLNDIPLLHIHGEKDTVTDSTHVSLYAQCRKSASAKTKMISLSNTDHEFSNPIEQKEAISHSVQWFKETL